MKYIVSILALLAGASRVHGQGQTIFAIANTNPAFSILATALSLTGLDNVLDCTRLGCNAFTVFAPPDAAFEALPAAVLTTLTTNPEFRTHLRSILLYHVLLGRVPAADIEDGAQVKTLLAGSTVETTLSNGNVFVDQAQVTTPDIAASNGIIHAVDSVLLPTFMTRNIVQVATDAGLFGTLLAAIDAAGLTAALEVCVAVNHKMLSAVETVS